MLLFSTLLPINKGMTKDDFIKLVIRWNKESKYQSNVIPGVQWNGERSIRFGDEYLWLDIQEYRKKNIIAVRFEKIEADGVIWDTDYIVNFDERKIAIRLDRSYSQDAIVDNQKYSTPHFITLLIEEGYLERDFDLPMQRTPHVVDECSLPKLAEIIKDEKKYAFPIVYVSRTVNNEEPVDVGILAGRLKGVAHVLVQEDRKHNSILRGLCDDQNDFNGAIGVYFPNQAVVPKKFMYRETEGFDTLLLERVCRFVIQYSSTKVLSPLYTWQGVNNAILRDGLQSQITERIAAENARKKAEDETNRLLETRDEEEKRIKKQARDEAVNEANTLIESADEEMKDLQRRINELTKANEALQAENQGLKAKFDSVDSEPILYMGGEYEAYPGEIKDILLSVLSEAIPGLYENSRRVHVVKDIIANNDYKHTSDSRAEELKRLLKTYDGMPSKLKQDIERLGFIITDDGKHYKLQYHGDDRYTATLAKTPSDVRGGKNALQTIIRMVF